MSIVTLTSASGAPGVTTTTVGLAATWPGPAIAVEADPVGGSAMLAGFFRGFQPPRLSVVDLVLAHRDGRLAEEFPDALIPLPGTGAAILPGPRSHAQARSALDLWEPLTLIGQALDNASVADLSLPRPASPPDWPGATDSSWGADPSRGADTTRINTIPRAADPSRTTTDGSDRPMGTDLLVDAGRLGMESYPQPLLDRADLVILVVNSSLPSVAAAKQWADQAVAHRRDHPEAPEWAVLLVGPGQPYSPAEVSRVLAVPLVGSVRHDPAGASVYSHGSSTRRRTALNRDLARCVTAIRDRLDTADRLLGRPDATADRPLGRPDVDRSPGHPDATDHSSRHPGTETWRHDPAGETAASPWSANHRVTLGGAR